jgi:Flp pilus assembly protein TadB
VAKERARKRAEREAAAAKEREQRARKRARKERVDRAKAKVSSAIPDRPKTAPGLLARRRRRRLLTFALAIIAIQIIVWPFLPSWGARLLLLALTLLAAPVVWVLSFGRV